MPAAFEELMVTIIKVFLIPLVLIVAPIVLARIDSRNKKTNESTREANESVTLEAIANTRVQVLKHLEIIVGAAVASNMDLAEKFKETNSDGKLTEEEVIDLKRMAKDKIYKMLPSNIVSGVILAVIGGEEVLDNMIYNFIDKQVIEIRSHDNS